MQSCLSYPILPYDLTWSSQWRGPRRRRYKRPPALRHSLHYHLYLDTPFLFFFTIIFPLPRCLGFGHSLSLSRPTRHAEGCNPPTLVDCSSDAQMRRSTFSPHRPRLQQLAGSVPLLTTLRSSEITCNLRSAFGQIDVGGAFSDFSIFCLPRFYPSDSQVEVTGFPSSSSISL